VANVSNKILSCTVRRLAGSLSQPMHLRSFSFNTCSNLLVHLICNTFQVHPQTTILPLPHKKRSRCFKSCDLEGKWCAAPPRHSMPFKTEECTTNSVVTPAAGSVICLLHTPKRQSSPKYQDQKRRGDHQFDTSRPLSWFVPDVPRLSFNGQVANFITLINSWSLHLYYMLECVRAEASYRLIMSRETKRAYMGI